MTTFVVTNLATGAEVYRYEADAAIEWAGLEFATHDHTELVALPAEPTLLEPRRLTKLDFIGRLAPEEFAQVLVAAKTDPGVEMFVKMLDWTTADPDGTSINLDDERTVTGVRTLFSAERADAILGVVHG